MTYHRRIRHYILLCCLLAYAARAGETAPPSTADNGFFSKLRETAADLSRQPFAPLPQDLPDSLRNLDYDAYRMVVYHRDKAVWAEKNLPFNIEFHHRGYLFKDRVEINLIEAGEVREARFTPELFRYHRGLPGDLDDNLGFAGFRIWYRSKTTNKLCEIVSFLGACYFRGTPPHGAYGVSARAIAIDTAVAGAAEEFPSFRKFWIVRPEPGAEELTVYALLDGPSIVGAYQFIIRSGEEIVILVRESLYVRQPIKALGLAPLSSMFLYGENSGLHPHANDSRPEVHDSDGLLLHTGEGEWVPALLGN